MPAHQPAESSPDDMPGGLDLLHRPLLRYVDTQLPQIVDTACNIAVNSRAEIYARGTSLFRPVRIERPTRIGSLMRMEGATILVPIDKPALVDMLTALIDFRKYDSRLARDPWKPVACPAVVAETIIARRGGWPFPQLRAVISTPTLRPDGSLLTDAGFDHQTGILFRPEVEWPKIPDQPSRADAEQAKAKLLKLVGTFPFAGPVDRSAALTMIMTAIVRTCLPTSPLFGVSAPTPGTGKSKLVDIAAILATGSAAAVLSAPREEAELQKHVGAILMAGDAFISLDNIEHPLRSEFLCQALTQETVAVRVLGESRTLRLPTVATFCATGNSLRFAGDLTRRVVIINLDAGMERPEERVFKNDAVKLAKEYRVALVVAALTILRAFVVADRPRTQSSFGSFEAWSDLVRSALVWVGEADPLGNAGQVRDADPEHERTAAIINALSDRGTWKTSDIAKLIQEDNASLYGKQHEALTEALADMIERGHLHVTRFGHFLRKNKNRIVGGRRIVLRGLDRNGVAMWSIELAGDAGD
jgi:putative DNA primase/helicase